MRFSYEPSTVSADQTIHFVEITKAERPIFWYAKLIGQVVPVVDDGMEAFWWLADLSDLKSPTYHTKVLKKSDCEILKCRFHGKT